MGKGLVVVVVKVKYKKFLFLDLHTLGIWNTTQPNGLAVPDASMHSVNSMQNVLELMNIGMMNRATSATALNERSSRSHRLHSHFKIFFYVNFPTMQTQNLILFYHHMVAFSLFMSEERK